MESGANFSPFYKFLVIKIAERVQQISRDRCSGCTTGYILDQLHPCSKLSLDAKIEMFLPMAKNNAQNRINQLYELFTRTTYVDSFLSNSYIEAGQAFIESLELRSIIDRRYINEDSVIEHPFDQTWLVDTPIQKTPPREVMPFLENYTPIPLIEVDVKQPPKKRGRGKDQQKRKIPKVNLKSN